MLMKIRFFLSASLVMALAGTARAHEAPPGNGEENIRKNDVVGGVFHSDSKKPLGNVSVTAYVANRKEKVVYTDAGGHYAFDALKPGTYRFVFEKPGYRKVVREKTIARADEAAGLSVFLEEHSTYDFTPGPAHFFEFL